jgi:hydrogenase-4 component F
VIAALLLVPSLAGLAAFLVRKDGIRRALLVLAALLHAALSAAAWILPARAPEEAWLALDAPGLLFLSITSALFLAASFYAVGYLAGEGKGERRDLAEGLFFANAPEAVFTGCLLFFLATMTLVVLSRHLGLLWVGVEATTLASAPLIYFHRHHRSLEATWKYLLICSVGIGLALLGNFCFAVSASGGSGDGVSLLFPSLASHARSLQVPWLKAGFLCLLVGYGTKMGLSPLHTWLPDAHSESPSLVSALLSGALLNCAFLGILRGAQVCAAAGEGAFSGDLLVLFGLVSMGTAAVFLVGQVDYKRMLAYSSVEHMGILALGAGLGQAGLYASGLHALNHSLVKACLFLVAGNLLGTYRSKSSEEVRGILKGLPVSGVLWLAGFLAITGSPPFGPFLSELAVLKAALGAGRIAVAAAYLAFLGIAFVAMATVFLRMAQGPSPLPLERPSKENPWTVVPPIVLISLSLLLGLYVPPALQALLRDAAACLGGTP